MLPIVMFPHYLHRRPIVVLLLFLCLLAGSMFAGTNGTLEGVVKDKRTGDPLPGAHITVIDLQSGVSTDLNGHFEIQNVRAGSYEVRCSRIGYQTRLLQNVAVNPDLRTRLVITLEPTSVELGEVIVVQEKPLIQADVTGTTYIVGGDELAALPVDRITDVIGLKPGVTLEGNVRGGKANEVSYLVDGLPVRDFMTGDAVVWLPQSSITGVSVQTGGFAPEYGNALSGVVNIVTRTGGDTHQFFARAQKDNLLADQLPYTQHNRTNQFECAASGPVAGDAIHYLAAINGLFTDTRWWQDFDNVFSSPIDRTVSAFGKVDVVLTPTLRLSTQGIFSDHAWHDYEFSWRYNLGGLPSERKSSHRIAAMVSQTISDRFYYVASLSRAYVRSQIGDGPLEHVNVNDPFQYDFFLRYVISGSRALWTRSSQENYTAKFDGTLNAGNAHLLKLGAELTLYGLQSDLVRLEPRRTYFGKPLLNEPQLNFSSSYEYHPRSGSIYIQDKLDLLQEGILLNFGLRYDFLDPRAERPNIEAVLLGDTAYAYRSHGAVRASLKQQLSPRFGAALQVAERAYFFVNLGWYFQYPLFDYLFTGLDRVGLSSGVAALTGNPDLEPERSTSWEMSVKYVLPLDMVASVTYFHRETTNQIDTKTFVPGDSKLAGSFGFSEFVNNPSAEASGFELVLSRERGSWVTGEVSYTYMTAEGTSGSAYDGFYIAQFGLPPEARAYPLSWDQRHTIKAVLDLTPTEGLDARAVVQWHSGRPYTNYPTSTGFEPVVGGRFYENNARMPSYFTLDLKLIQHFVVSWWQGARLAIIADIRNLTNERNVLWMDSNGRVGGELGDPSGYTTGRRSSIGLQVEF